LLGGEWDGKKGMMLLDMVGVGDIGWVFGGRAGLELWSRADWGKLVLLELNGDLIAVQEWAGGNFGLLGIDATKAQRDLCPNRSCKCLVEITFDIVRNNVNFHSWIESQVTDTILERPEGVTNLTLRH